MADSDRNCPVARKSKGDALLIAMLASGSTIKDAANSAGVSERTARRRLDDPGFCQRVNEAQAALVGQATGVLAAGMTEAAETLKSLLQAQSERTRLSAARAILWLGLKVRETAELEARLLEIEKAMA